LKIRTDSHIQVLDTLRAFAALSVCLFHFVCTTTGYFTDPVLLSIFDVGQYGVQMFFVISGFVIPWSMHHAGYQYKNFLSFFLKRLSRLEPPYLVSVILALVLLFAREKVMGKANDHIEISSTQIFLHLGYLIPFFKEYHWLNSVYWTLAVEFQYYLFIALLFVPLIKSKLISRILIYIGICVVSFFFPENFLPYSLPVFLLGILLFLFKASYIKNEEYYTSTLLLLILCFWKYPFVSVLFSLIPVVSILYFEKLKIAGLHFAGKFSYSIYLIHPILGASFINVLSHRLTAPMEKVVVICAGIVVTLISSYIMYIVVERPSKRLSASIKYKSQNNQH